jgi:hypothetical protein
MPINSNMNFSPAGMALGLGGIGGQNLGTNLQDQVIDDTEQLRKKRMQEAQQRALLGTAGSAAGTALGLGGSVFGGIGGTGLLR